jgi:hypothetical protein
MTAPLDLSWFGWHGTRGEHAYTKIPTRESAWELKHSSLQSQSLSGTYCKDTDTGGSNGAGMRYEQEGGDPANAGLQHARVFLEPVKEKHPWITYADREWTLSLCSSP